MVHFMVAYLVPYMLKYFLYVGHTAVLAIDLLILSNMTERPEWRMLLSKSSKCLSTVNTRPLNMV
jgi:hypothetical protein